MATILKRVSLKPPIDVSEEIRKLAREAYLILGYRDLLDKIGEPTERLATILHRLGIKPFTRESVGKYQEEKLEEARDKNKGNGYFYWNKSLLRASSDVPAFVLRKAIQIQVAAPEARLYVESLTNHPDPFLIVKQGNEEYYVEVWDEPGFEIKL